MFRGQPNIKSRMTMRNDGVHLWRKKGHWESLPSLKKEEYQVVVFVGGHVNVVCMYIKKKTL